MKIELWRSGLLHPTRVGDSLIISLYKGKAHASWKSRAFLSSRLIAVSDSLAKETLGAVRRSCPHIGEMPVLSSVFSAAGYTVRGQSSVDDSCKTLVECHVCGYWNDDEEGNPRFASAAGRSPGCIHPEERTYLSATTQFARFTSADWSEADKNLVPSSVDGRLIIWLRPEWFPGRIQRMFPEAKMVWSETAYCILRQR